MDLYKALESQPASCKTLRVYCFESKPFLYKKSFFTNTSNTIKFDEVCSNVRVPARVNTTPTRINTRQHESDMNQHKSRINQT